MIIYKYQLNLKPSQLFTTVRVPSPCSVVSVGKDAFYNSCVWLMHPVPTEDIKMVKEQFQIRGTGDPFDPGWIPVGTINDGAYFWHVLQFKPQR